MAIALNKDWQPIDTAPRPHDGVVILYTPSGVTVGYWNENTNSWFGWHDDYLDEQPTHWMPLPEEPI